MLHRKSTGSYNYTHLEQLSLGEACIAELESRLGDSASLLGDIFRSVILNMFVGRRDGARVGGGAEGQVDSLDLGCHPHLSLLSPENKSLTWCSALREGPQARREFNHLLCLSLSPFFGVADAVSGSFKRV